MLMNHQADEYFVEKAKHGDTRAFGVLVERYQNYIFTLAYRMLKVREEAEEIAQDSFLKAYDALQGFRGESKFSTWLYRIAYRKSLDRLKKNSTLRTSELIEDFTEDHLSYVDSGLDHMLKEERSKIINKCILKLPEQEAAIITLYYFEEQSVKEIAQVMELGEDNVKVKLFRSRKLLFTFLENYINQEKPVNNGKAV